MAPSKLVEYNSEDEELVPSEVGEAEDDDDNSLADFINDEAVEEDESEDEAESETVESDNDGFVQLKHSTPPGQKRKKPVYRQESDDDSVPNSANFSADDPASPKKKSGKTDSRGRRDARRSVEADDSDDDKPLKRDDRVRSDNRSRKITEDEDGADHSPEPPSPRKIARKAPIIISDDDEPVVIKKKFPTKAVTLHDSDIEEISPPPAKGSNKRGSATTKSPKKKVVVKSKAVVDDTDDDEDEPDAVAPRKNVGAKSPTKVPSKKNTAEDEDSDSPVVTPKKVVAKSVAPLKTPRKTVKDGAGHDEPDHVTPKSARKSPVKTAKSATLDGDARKHKATTKQSDISNVSDDVSVVEDSEDEAELATKLVGGDSMYKERRTPKAQPANLKRSLQLTPPYNTRASAVEQVSPLRKKKKTEEDESAIHSKKTKVKVKVEEDIDMALPLDATDDDGDTPAKKVSSTTKVMKHNKEVMGTPSTPKASNGGRAVESTPRSNKPASSKRLFLKDEDDVFENPHSSTSNTNDRRIVFNQKYLDHLWSALAPPDSCEVTDDHLLDDYFVSVGGYEGLTPLRFCELKNTGALYTGTPSGTFKFGACVDSLSEDQFAAVSSLIQFSMDGRVVNLSRVDPGAIGGRKMNDTRHEIVVKNKTALCVSVGLVRESAVDPSADFGGPIVTRGVRLVFLTYEYERFTAVLGEIARRRSLMTHVWNFGVTIGTKPVKRDEDESAPTAKGNTNNLPAAFFNTYVSPNKAARTSTSVSIPTPNSIGHLETHDNIPVYDARDLPSDFDWIADVFERPADYFKTFPLSKHGGEIPENALCAPVYVTQVYSWYGDRDTTNRKAKAKAAAEPQDLRLGLFIRYVLVLAIL